MKIGIDLRSLEAGSQNRGIGRYATSLLAALGKIDHKNEYVLFTSQKSAALPEITLHEKFRPSTAHGKKPWLRNLKYIRIVFIGPKQLDVDRYGLDVFFHIDPTQPIKCNNTPVVSVLYDLIPYLPAYKPIYQYVHFGGYSPGRLIGYSRVKLRWKQLERSVNDYQRAHSIVSISDHSKRDLVTYLPSIDPDKIVTIPLAAGSTNMTKGRISKRLQKLKGKPFLFYVGGADPRKGLVQLTRSMEQLWETDPDVWLVMAGKEITDIDVPEARKLAQTVASLSKPKQIIRLGFISDEELAWFYHHAAAFVFPSEYEGFGLPILEAMQVGCPVITYANSSIPEVAGDAAILVPDGETFVPYIHRLLRDTKLRADLIASGKKQASKFTWDKTARATLRVLERAGMGGKS